MNVQTWMWFAVLAGIVVMLLIDLFAHRHAAEISLREAAGWSAFWVSLGLGFGGLVWAYFGPEFAQQYYSGFVIEKSLAVDNVFIWALIFASFGVPRKYQHRVLFLGVLGALLFRGLFIAAGAALLKEFAWVIYIFAAFLIYTGIRMLVSKDEHQDPADSSFFRWFSKVLPTTEKIYGARLFVRRNGLLLATPLLSVLALVEFTDIIFAVDSIPAIFAVTDEPFLVFTANAFAILGLRAMYFLLADLMHRFVYLKVGLAGILVWVGIKMALHYLVKIPTALSLGVIVLILTVSIVASLRATRGQSVESHHDSGTTATGATAKPKLIEATAEEIAQLGSVLRRA